MTVYMFIQLPQQKRNSLYNVSFVFFFFFMCKTWFFEFCNKQKINFVVKFMNQIYFEKNKTPVSLFRKFTHQNLVTQCFRSANQRKHVAIMVEMLKRFLKARQSKVVCIFFLILFLETRSKGSTKKKQTLIQQISPNKLFSSDYFVLHLQC